MSDTQSTALVPVEQRAALALNTTETEKHLRELATKHASITEIKNKDGREQAHGAAMELLKARTTIEKVSKAARDDATKFSKAVIAEENRLIAITSAEEKRLFALRDEWDAEQERIRQEKVLAEQRRMERINQAIASITAIPNNLTNAKADVIAAAIAELEAVAIVEEFYEEFTDKALYVRSEALETMNTLYAAAVERELEAQRLAEEQARIAEENARLAAERAELERQRQELEAERARAAAEAALAAQRAADEANAKAKAEAAQREAFEKQQRDAFEEEKRAAQELLAQQQAELAAERERLAAQVRAQRDAEEAERRNREVAERAAQEAVEQMNAHQVIESVADHFGCGEEEAEEKILRAANVINTNRIKFAEAA